MLLSVFIYWGWDSTVTVNEESENSNETPGRAAVVSTFILLATYVIVAVAAQAYNGPQDLIDNSDDIFSALGHRRPRLAAGQAADHRRAHLGGGLDPDDDPADRAHVAVDGAGEAPCPSRSGASTRASSRRTSRPSSWAALSIVWYVGLTIVSENILFDSIAALGLMIAFYYGLTGFACVIYYRRELFKSARNFVMIGVAADRSAGSCCSASS